MWVAEEHLVVYGRAFKFYGQSQLTRCARGNLEQNDSERKNICRGALLQEFYVELLILTILKALHRLVVESAYFHQIF